MKWGWWLLVLCAFAPGAAADVCPLFTVERQGSAVTIVRDSLGEGEVSVLQRDIANGVIDVVLPVGPGQSAGFFQPSDTDRIIARFAGGRLTVKVQRADSSSVDLPARDLADLRAQDIRVSVTTGDGARRAFLIARYASATPDTAGPAQNLFAEQLPEALMRAGVVIMTDTYTQDPEVRACGRAPLEHAGYLFTLGRRADGTEGWFIVDLAAAASIVARSFLPAGQEIHPLSMSEHSAAGTRVLPFRPEGATGQVESVAGATVLPGIEFGKLVLSNVSMTVIEQMPEGFGRPVAGILGMDVLRGCGRLALQLPHGAARGALELSEMGATGAAAETPFSWIASHLVVRGTLDGVPAHWILDTGSPHTVVDSVGAPPLAMAGAQPPGTLRGLNATPMPVAHKRAASLTVGALKHHDVPCDVAPLTVFAGLREPGYALGVLGLDDIARYGRVEVDFTRRVVRWFR